MPISGTTKITQGLLDRNSVTTVSLSAQLVTTGKYALSSINSDALDNNILQTRHYGLSSIVGSRIGSNTVETRSLVDIDTITPGTYGGNYSIPIIDINQKGIATRVINSVPVSGQFLGVDVYSSPGTFTWTRDANVKNVFVIVTGGGGGTSVVEGGGGGGGTAMAYVNVANITTATVEVGPGGDVTPTNGGISAFVSSAGVYASALGGFANNNTIVNTGNGGDGGSGIVGQIRLNGGGGGYGGANTVVRTANGGASFWGGGQKSRSTTNTARVQAPGGGGAATAGAPTTGGEGATGIVVIYKYS